MNTYKLKIDEEALQDIQKVTDWYNEQLQGLGTRFQKQVKTQINALKKMLFCIPNVMQMYAVYSLKNFHS